MLEKNKRKLEHKQRQTWSPYYSRITKNKKAYDRKKFKKSIDNLD